MQCTMHKKQLTFFFLFFQQFLQSINWFSQSIDLVMKPFAWIQSQISHPSESPKNVLTATCFIRHKSKNHAKMCSDDKNMMPKLSLNVRCKFHCIRNASSYLHAPRHFDLHLDALKHQMLVEHWRCLAWYQMI